MIHDISHEWPPFTFEFPVDPCTPAFATNRHCAIRIWCMYIVHVAEVLELVVSNWSMGWDGMGHRGLQNKWPGLPVAILLRVFGSIEHLNELEQRNIGIRRGLDCLASDPAYSIFSAFAAAPFSRDSYFVESRFLVESLILIALLLRGFDFDEINFLPFQTCLLFLTRLSSLRVFFL